MKEKIRINKLLIREIIDQINQKLTGIFYMYYIIIVKKLLKEEIILYAENNLNYIELKQNLI